MLEPDSGFLEDVFYFNALVLWDCIPEQASYDLYDSAWNEFARYSPQDFESERSRLIAQKEEVLARVGLLDIVLPLLESVVSSSAAEKAVADVSGVVPEIDGLRMTYDAKKKRTSIFVVIPPGVTDGKAFAATLKRKVDALQRLRKHQFDLYYRFDMRLRALDLVRICRQTLPALPLFKSIARFDRRVTDEGGRPRNWYQEVSRIGHAVTYFSSNRQNKSIGELEDYMAERDREPVARHAIGEDLKRTCRKWGISLWTGMGVESYRTAVGSVWSQMQESSDPLIQRAVDRFSSEQKEIQAKKKAS